MKTRFVTTAVALLSIFVAGMVNASTPALAESTAPHICTITYKNTKASVKGLTFNLHSVVEYNHKGKNNYTYLWFSITKFKASGKAAKGTLHAFHQVSGSSTYGKRSVRYSTARSYHGAEVDYPKSTHPYYGQQVRYVISVPGRGSVRGPLQKVGAGETCPKMVIGA